MNQRLGILILLGAVGVFLLVFVIGSFSDYLPTKLPTSSVKRVTLHQGDSYSIPIKLSAAVKSAKVEICRVVNKKDQCRALLAKATTAKANVRIPTNQALGNAVIRVVERNAAGQLTGKIQFQRSVLIVKAALQEPAGDGGGGGGGGGGGSGGGGGGGSGSGSGGSTGTQIQPVNYELLHLCYEGADDSIHMRWRPMPVIVKYRKAGETIWHNPSEEYGIGSNPYTDFEDSRSTIIYTHTNDLPPFTDFEFYFIAAAGAPAGLPAESQVYRYNTGATPGYFECRSLL